MGAMRLAAVTLLLLPGVGVTAEAEPQGVGPADKQAYERKIAERFTCLDGVQKISLSAMNDDFCDCADGSDEPGTAACSGTDYGRASEVFFYCENNGSRPRYVYRSRVLDGVCDCCDGSDETLPSGMPTVAGRAEICPNFCHEEMKPYRERQQRARDEWQSILELKTSLAETTEKNLTNLRAELEWLQEELVKLKIKKEDAETNYNSLHKGLKENIKWTEFRDLKALQAKDGDDALKKALRTSKHWGPESQPDYSSTTTTTSKRFDMPVEVQEAWLELLRTEDGAAVSRSKVQELAATLDSQMFKEHQSLAKLAGECIALEEDEDTDEPITYQVCFFRDATVYGVFEDINLEDRVHDNGTKKDCSREPSEACVIARGTGPAKNESFMRKCHNMQRMLDCQAEFGCCGNMESVVHMNDQIKSQINKHCPDVRNPCARKQLGRWAGWRFHGQKAPHAEFKNGTICRENSTLQNELVVKFVCGAKVRMKAMVEVSTCRWEAAVIHPAACVDSLRPKEHGSKLDKFKENVAKKEAMEIEADEMEEEWLEHAAHFKSEVTRLENETIHKKELYETAKKDAGKKVEKKTSEYTKWMEVENVETTTTTTELWADQGDEHDELRGRLREARKVLPFHYYNFWNAKWREKGLEVIVHDDLNGTRRALADLESRCLRTEAIPYSYEVCFFRQVVRNETVLKDGKREPPTHLGRFLRWDFSGSLPVAFFGRGDWCNFENKIAYETYVTIHCGKNFGFLSLEVEKECKTKIAATHLAACDPSTPPPMPEMPTGALRPKDEL